MKLTIRDIKRYQTQIGEFLTAIGSRKIKSDNMAVIINAQTQMKERGELFQNMIKRRLQQ